MSERGLTLAAIAALLIGVALMIPFEATATRIGGVLALFAFIVIGVFAIANPDRLGGPAEERDPPDPSG